MADSAPSHRPTASTPALREEVRAYYARGDEDARLRTGVGRLEYLRTQDVLRRLLPAAPARVLDVGGGSGVHAAWLAEDGYHVEVIDPVPAHVELASALPGVTARVGDARALPVPDGSADAVLMLGPLYHLTEREERVRALREARRAVGTGGPVVAATINRWAGLHDLLNQGTYFDPRYRTFMDAVTRDGQHHHFADGGFFAYLHEPAEVPEEFADAGLALTGQYGLEGTVWLMHDAVDWLGDPERRQAVLDALRQTESVPSLLGVSGHLLTAGTAGRGSRVRR